MAISELECPVCSADIPLAGDEKKNDEIVCVFCGSPLRLTEDVKSTETVELEEDFSPVNLFRLIFDLYFGTDLGPLEARSYYTFQSQPFHYFDATDPDNIREGGSVPVSGFAP